MKWRSIIGGAVISIIVVLTMTLMMQLQNYQLSNLDITHQVNGNKQYRIAILTHVHVPQIDSIIKRFNAMLQKANLLSYSTKFYCAKGDTSLLRNMVNDIVDSNYDLIWSIGTTSSRALKTLCKKRGSKSPILCSNVIDYMWNRWMSKNEYLKKYMSGSIGGFNWKNRLTILQFLHPTIKHVLIPYASHANDYYKVIDRLKAQLTSMDIQSTVVFIDNYDALSKMRPYLDDIDTIILARDVKLLQMLPSIVKMANLQSIPIFTADTSSIHKGAAFGIGMDEGMSGAITAQQALRLLYYGACVRDIAPIDLDDCAKQFTLNRKAVSKQGPKISDELMFIIDKGFVSYNNESML